MTFADIAAFMEHLVIILVPCAIIIFSRVRAISHSRVVCANNSRECEMALYLRENI